MLDFGFYNMDCMDGMKEFPDKYFDLAIVDPPYGDAGGGSGMALLDSVNASTVTRGGGTDNPKTSNSQTERGVMRTGGTWAAKFAKKS